MMDESANKDAAVNCQSILVLAALAILVWSCQSPSRKPQSSESRPRVTAAPGGYSWYIPPDYPTFGLATSNSIRVAILGYSVRRGYYYLPQDATVKDAMEAAKFSGHVWWKRPYCGIQRGRPDGSVETIWFTHEGRATDELRVLQNDDRLCISHEVY